MKILALLTLSFLVFGCSKHAEGPRMPRALTGELPGAYGDPYAYDSPVPPRRNFLPRHRHGVVPQSSAGGSASTGNGIASESMDANVGIGSRSSSRRR
jgi:hypothetical protein